MLLILFSFSLFIYLSFRLWTTDDKTAWMNNKFSGNNCIQFVHGIEEHLIVAITSYCNSQHCLAESVKEKVQLWEQGKIIIFDNACKHYSALQMYSLIHCNSEKTIKSHGSSFYTLKLFFSLVYNITSVQRKSCPTARD